MALTNTATHYGAITKMFHWLTALLIMTLIPTGWWANQLPYDTSEQLARKAWFFSLHKTIGVAVFFVALGRIGWALSQAKPGLLNADKRLESFAAELVHWVLYASLVLVPLSGWISHAAAAGYAPIWWPFGQGLPLVPQSTSLEHIAGSIHWLATKALLLALLLHIAGALKHHRIDKDVTLQRMLPGTPQVPALPAQPNSRLPVFAAAAVWALVLAAGAVMGQDRHGTTTPVAALEEVSSDWQVKSGEIAITISQFGSDVTGSFADWTAAITFDPDTTTPEAGSVETRIAIGSLTLGSVTDQAMGADFFDAANFAQAVFTGDLLVITDGYEAVGTLTIKDKTIPLRFPFNLRIEGDSAEMDAQFTLDRRDFGIGDNMADESSLKFPVAVSISLTATKAP